MRIEVVLRKGEDPHIYDLDSKRKVDGKIRSLTLFPQQEGRCMLETYKLDEKGQHMLEPNPDVLFEPSVYGGVAPERLAIETVEAELVYLRGDWEAKG